MSNKAIFLDRDDTLIEDPGYINHPDQVKLLDGIDKSLIELKAMGYKLIVVSNQSGVARGIVSEQVLDEIHNRLKQLLAEKGAPLDRIYYCPYHPDGIIKKYRKESDWRKPNPGMLLAAADEMDIDLSQSWMIGNSNRDIEAGLQAGCKTILINHPWHYKQHKLGEPNPDYRAVNIKEAVNIIKKHHRSPGENPIQNQLLPQTLTKPPSQTAEEPHQPQPAKPETVPAEQNISGNRTEQLLDCILEQLKSMRRSNMFGEFSIMRLMAGIVQIIVLLCLLISIWFLMSPTRQDNAVLITLGFAVVLQVMALTFYIMHGRK
jgi:D-glycero-D-manno-heptose 1,7-bisphosphate phosphatase